MLQALEKVGTSAQGIDALFAAFRDAVLQHADREEFEEFPELRARSGEELRVMAAAIKAAVIRKTIGGGSHRSRSRRGRRRKIGRPDTPLLSGLLHIEDAVLRSLVYRSAPLSQARVVASRI